MPTILIADDHPLFRVALAQALRGIMAAATVLEAATLQQARQQLELHADIDLVLLDLHLPDSHGLMGLAALRNEYAHVAVVMISAHDDPQVIRRALAFGAAGYIPKRVGLDELTEALGTVLDCREWVPGELRSAVARTQVHPHDAHLAQRLGSLTTQQFKVLRQVAEGRLNKQIADSLGVQERTIKAHLSAIFEKLGVRNRTQAGVLLGSLDLADPAQRLDAPP